MCPAFFSVVKLWFDFFPLATKTNIPAVLSLLLSRLHLGYLMKLKNVFISIWLRVTTNQCCSQVSVSHFAGLLLPLGDCKTMTLSSPFTEPHMQQGPGVLMLNRTNRMHKSPGIAPSYFYFVEKQSDRRSHQHHHGFLISNDFIAFIIGFHRSQCISRRGQRGKQTRTSILS